MPGRPVSTLTAPLPSATLLLPVTYSSSAAAPAMSCAPIRIDPQVAQRTRLGILLAVGLGVAGHWLLQRADGDVVKDSGASEPTHSARIRPTR